MYQNNQDGCSDEFQLDWRISEQFVFLFPLQHRAIWECRKFWTLRSVLIKPRTHACTSLEAPRFGPDYLETHSTCNYICFGFRYILRTCGWPFQPSYFLPANHPHLCLSLSKLSSLKKALLYYYY